MDRPDSRPTRRAFLGLVASSAGMVALGGVIRLLDPPRRFFRPPGALPEAEFIALCTRCGQCQQTCPSVIALVPLSESITAAGTPIVRFGCTYCMRCNYVCPTGALNWLH